MVAREEENFAKLFKIRPVTHLQSNFHGILMERGIFCLEQFEQTARMAA